MKYRICISALLLWAGMQLSASNNQEEVVIKIIETSDVHGYPARSAYSLLL